MAQMQEHLDRNRIDFAQLPFEIYELTRWRDRGMDQSREFVIRLSLTDRYRHRHVRMKNRVVFFRVQLETRVEDRWMPVVRYDTAHGYTRDLLDRHENMVKTPLFNQDLNDALTFAENDLKTNWRSYRFLEGL